MVTLPFNVRDHLILSPSKFFRELKSVELGFRLNWTFLVVLIHIWSKIWRVNVSLFQTPLLEGGTSFGLKLTSLRRASISAPSSRQ
ncbi:hypothetical protein Y032_0600g493 [Ancylostoma ceylanicum]|uniref:Uncharacterized protein n=1 Tax=Ancylostoma ceylanicum TaxID=53326 RepID=A0A016WMA4_9BILA|nr:hypothetical protein Y032_0600g493 [Ancylostoma ceylanicum]